MKLLLTKDIPHLGIVGDVVNVSAGYGRNYLLPKGLGTAATDANMRALAEDRKQAEERRRVAREAMMAAVDRLREVEITIAAAANEDGALYGSVGPREIASALRDEGHEVDAAHVHLDVPIRRLDKVMATVKLADEISAEVTVWVVRSQASIDEDEGGENREQTQDEESD